jgi:hypothetical protein
MADALKLAGVGGRPESPCKPRCGHWDVRDGFVRGEVALPSLQAALALNGDGEGQLETECPGYKLLGGGTVVGGGPLGLSLCNNVNKG